MLVYGKCECFVMQMFVSCVHTVAVLMTFFMLVKGARGDHMENTYSRAGLNTCVSPSVYPILLQ